MPEEDRRTRQIEEILIKFGIAAKESGKNPGTNLGELRTERTRLLDKLRP